jgi:hypothetical protein
VPGNLGEGSLVERGLQQGNGGLTLISRNHPVALCHWATTAVTLRVFWGVGPFALRSLKLRHPPLRICQ